MHNYNHGVAVLKLKKKHRTVRAVPKSNRKTVKTETQKRPCLVRVLQ